MQHLVIKVPAMKEHVLIVENDEHPMEGPHLTDAEMRKCSVCGFTRRDAPSALKVCCEQPMEIIPDRRRHLDKEHAEVDRRKLLH